MGLKYKLILVNLVILIFPFCFIGCWDKTELSKIALVMGVGIDKIPGDMPVRVTLEIVSPGSSGKGENTPRGKSNSTIQTGSGKSFYDAIQKLAGSNPAKLDFSHNQIIVLSKSLCESGVSESLDYIERNEPFRVTEWVLVSNNSAKEILESKIANEEITSNGIRKMMNFFKNSCYVLPVNVNDFIVQLKSEAKSSFAPLIEIDKFEGKPSGKIKVENTAVLKNGRFIGILTNQESRVLMWLFGNHRGDIIVFPFKDITNITIEVIEQSFKINPYISNGEWYFKISSKGKAYLKETSDMEVNEETVKKIEKNTEAVLKDQLNELIKKSQNELNVDLIGFSKTIHNEAPQEWNDIVGKWDEIYPDLKYNISFEIELANIGMIKHSVLPKDKEKEGK
jgi:Ger(x)C family germination protein